MAAVVAVPDSLPGVAYGINVGQWDCGLGTRLILLLCHSLLMNHVFGPLVICDTPNFPSYIVPLFWSSDKSTWSFDNSLLKLMTAWFSNCSHTFVICWFSQFRSRSPWSLDRFSKWLCLIQLWFQLQMLQRETYMWLPLIIHELHFVI